MRLNDLLTNATRRTPGAVAALQPDGAAITYGALDDYAERISASLVAAGVLDGDRVGLCLTKTIGALASVFGVLKAGAAYIPVDVGAPAPRNAYIFNDCDVKAIIVETNAAHRLLAELPDKPWSRHPLPAPTSHPADCVILSRPAAQPERFAAAPDLAYILYTSGSTGRPKGVMHSHATALAFIDWCSTEFLPVASDRFSSHAPFHFDLSILDIYVPIKHGASVVLIDSETGKQPGQMAALIADQRITFWYSTPSVLRVLLEFGQLEKRDCSSLRVLNFAGEVFPPKHLQALMSVWPHPVYYNLYGPTETNVCTFYKLPGARPLAVESALPIGVKCSGDETRIVDRDGRDVAPGQEGELVVAGGSVMLGYWNMPERNAEAFLEHEGVRWYRTGDIVTVDPTGQLVFVGRRDRMIKRRGFRVELGEIEAALLRHPAITEAAVVAMNGSDGELQVCAFHTWTDSAPPSLIKLKQFCSQQLPLYMTPDRLKLVELLPKTSTDKIDYQRLKELL